MSGTALSPIDLSAWFLIGLGGLLLLSLVIRLIRWLVRRFRPVSVWQRYTEEASPFRRRRRGGWTALGALLTLLFGALLIGLGWGGLRTRAALQVYRPFPQEETIGQVQCLPDEAAGDRMTCTLRLTDPPLTETVVLPGARWGLEGEVWVWDPRLEELGFSSGYRLLHLVGYDQAGQVLAGAELPSAQGMEDWLLRLGAVAPFVRVQRDTLYGEAADDRFYELSVSPDGFALREWGPTRP